ncbi:rhoGEF domain-containing protein gxcJ-like [Stegodyphus dumicola]|uniref:rhoGEF domain-containing protein gxcJ-like n=1 Tax=Stegodyphus dumicola TaxID=202533 RepID=UPI0015B1F7D0|nr:rhoGEF domain-containing protein gxcJ-like [Stegodyphus dumicola]XP_035216681.1 rhoGEF domain-containing protein gxcJ-like [Stegodyphus dumicola]
MDGIRQQVEASLSRTRDIIMEDRYRRLHYETGTPQYWAQTPPKAVALARFKRHLPAIPKKKNKESSKKPDHMDIPAYAKHYKDKYGSVSAHSTSAIYGALRAPHYHAIYGPSDTWYASVRSLNRGCHRDVHPVEAYEWRETLYEDVTKEVFTVPPPVEMLPRPPCLCMVRRRPTHDGSHIKPSRHQPRCKYCTSAFTANGSANGGPLASKRPPINSEKVKPTGIPDENIEVKPESTSRMSGYKKCIAGTSKFKNSVFNKNISNSDSGKISRKSILECDVTAYDLIKKVTAIPSVTEIDDSDIDDNLSDNAIAKMNHVRWLKLQKKSKFSSSSSGSSRLIANKKHSSKFKKSQSENCIYSESHSVLVGGQRIFTENNRSKSPDLTITCDSSNDIEDDNVEFEGARWRKMSVSEESVCIPDPDYDFSDDSDDATVINHKQRDPRFTYSPPPTRKSSDESYNGLGYNSREISKSMSSLLSDDTYIPSINVNNSNKHSLPPLSMSDLTDCDNDRDFMQSLEDIERYNSYKECSPESENDISSNPELTLKQDSKYESSSDCSSSGGTLSSDYPTWTSSSSNELKSILKKKKRRDNAIQELEDATRVFRNTTELKEAQRKKQVQFQSGCEETKFGDDSSKDDVVLESNSHYEHEKETDVNDQDIENTAVINCDTYETLDDAAAEDSSEDVSRENYLTSNESGTDRHSHFDVRQDASSPTCSDCKESDYKRNSIKNSFNASQSSQAFSLDLRPSPPPSLPPKLPPARSSSLEDVRKRTEKGSVSLMEDKDKGHRRRRRATLPKRRFSDLHLHILLCPTRSSLCGDGSSRDDVPLTASARRAHRSLPESPSELDEVPSFCFDFLEKGSKEKVLSSSRSVFYVPVQNSRQTKCSENLDHSSNQEEVGNSQMTVMTSPVSPSGDDNSNHVAAKFEQADVCDPEENLSPEQYDTDEDVLENDYDNLDPIYEELSDVTSAAKRLTSLESNQKSFFEGASKIDILSYLEDAKERGISEGLSEDEKVIIEEEDEDEKVLSGEEEDIGEKNRVITNNTLNHKEALIKIEEDVEKEDQVETENTAADISKSSRISEVERNDSGVGTETSKPPRMKLLPADWEEQLCADCDHQVEPVEDEDSGLLFSPLVCRKCEFRRCERKEIIIEFVDTELKYGRDLRIIKEEFYRPMEIAGLLAKDQLLSIFLNLDELISANTKFSEKLQDALDIATEHGDEDYTTVNLGKIFLETSSMLHAFETYCVKQASASVLLSSLEKEKELLRIFLRVSQMENTLLRRMNLPAFLMVPVQRVTRYPLLLSRLHKVTPIHHKDRSALKEAQQKVELHLEHINQQTKGVGGTKIWRRISNISASHRRLGKDIGSIKLRKMALEVLNWKQDETRFVMAGKLLFTQITDYPWNKKGKTVKFTPLHALLIALGKPNSNYRPESSSTENAVLFPRNTGIRDASLVLMKEKNGRFIVVREPLYLGNCVISCDSETDDVFEIQEYTTKEAYLLKGETRKETKEWLRQLRYHAKDLGTWRKRRNALANIMINGMIRQ